MPALVRLLQGWEEVPDTNGASGPDSSHANRCAEMLDMRLYGSNFNVI